MRLMSVLFLLGATNLYAGQEFKSVSNINTNGNSLKQLDALIDRILQDSMRQPVSKKNLAGNSAKKQSALNQAKKEVLSLKILTPARESNFVRSPGVSGSGGNDSSGRHEQGEDEDRGNFLNEVPLSSDEDDGPDGGGSSNDNFGILGRTNKTPNLENIAFADEYLVLDGDAQDIIVQGNFGQENFMDQVNFLDSQIGDSPGTEEKNLGDGMAIPEAKAELMSSLK